MLNTYNTTSSKQRFVIFPIQDKETWKKYKEQMANFWTIEVIDWSQDYRDFVSKLNENERFYVKHVLAFFAASDGIVSKNLDTNFIKDAEDAGMLEAVFNYQFQLMMENIHNEAYSHMLDLLIKDSAEKDRLFNAIETVPSIKRKSEWALKWIGGDKTIEQLPLKVQKVLEEKYDELSDDMKKYVDAKRPSFSERLIAFAAIEGIFFSGSFCAIYWLKSNKKAMPGLCKANEWIARDEGAHQDFACLLYHKIGKRLSVERVNEIIMNAVEIEKEFVTEALPVRLINMNAESMRTYIEYIADRLLLQLGYPKIYKVKQPFGFIELLAMKPKTNFFEDRVSDYQRRGVVASASKDCKDEKGRFGKLSLSSKF